MSNSFKVYERLKREQHIHTLFRSGKAFSVFPIRFIYKLAPMPDGVPAPYTDCHISFFPVLAGFSVPKKKFSSSVDRHRVRRLMVEAWRLHKKSLIDVVPTGFQLHVFLIFNNKEMPDYQLVQSQVVAGIAKLAKYITTPPTPLPQSPADTPAQ